MFYMSVDLHYKHDFFKAEIRQSLLLFDILVGHTTFNKYFAR